MKNKIKAVVTEVRKSVWLMLKVVGVTAAVILLLLALSVATGGDSAPSHDVESDSVDVDGLNGSVDRFTDPETGATCYVFNNSSISCVNERGG